MNKFCAEGNTPAQDEGGLDLTPRPGALSAFLQRFGGNPTESYFFYGGSVEIRFDKKDHRYYLVNPELKNLTLLKNVSTVSKIVDRSFVLVPWSAKVCIEKLLRTIPTFVLPGGGIVIPQMTLEEFTEIALAAKSAHKETLEDAGDVGKEAHAWIEDYIKAKIAKDSVKLLQTLGRRNAMDPRASSCSHAMQHWETAHNVRWVSTESKVYSRTHKVCGTLDGTALVDSCDDPSCCRTAFKDHLSLIDWKTSNYLYTEYLYQTAMYEFMHMEEFPEEIIVDRWVIRLGKDDAEFSPWYLGPEDFEEDLAGFLACLCLSRIVDKVEDRMTAQKSQIRDIKKHAKAIAKEQAAAAEKAAKAEAKAQEKVAKQMEKERIKAAAKAEREANKQRIKDEARANRAQVLVEAITNPPVPNKTLVDAVERYKKFEIPTE